MALISLSEHGNKAGVTYDIVGFSIIIRPEPARASMVKARASTWARSIMRPLPRVDDTTDFDFCFSSSVSVSSWLETDCQLMS